MFYQILQFLQTYGIIVVLPADILIRSREDMEHLEPNEHLRLMFIMELIAQLSPAEQERIIAEIEAILSDR